jgi:hypothetical protein
MIRRLLDAYAEYHSRPLTSRSVWTRAKRACPDVFYVVQTWREEVHTACL